MVRMNAAEYRELLQGNLEVGVIYVIIYKRKRRDVECKVSGHSKEMEFLSNSLEYIPHGKNISRCFM